MAQVQSLPSYTPKQKGRFLTEPRVVDRGDGPKIEGTRITVYTVLEYLRAGRTRDWVAAMLNLSSRQVQAAIDYIRAHDAQVNVEYKKIQARIKQGKPHQVEAQLHANREKLRARLARQLLDHRQPKCSRP